MDIMPDDSIPLEEPLPTDSQPHVHRQLKALFRASTSPSSQGVNLLHDSYSMTLDLRYVAESSIDGVPVPKVRLLPLDLKSKGHLGLSVFCDMELVEGQAVTFVLRIPPPNAPPKQGTPTESQARALGVPLQSAFAYFCLHDIV